MTSPFLMIALIKMWAHEHPTIGQSGKSGRKLQWRHRQFLTNRQ